MYTYEKLCDCSVAEVQFHLKHFVLFPIAACVHAVHTGSVSVTERHAQIVNDMVRTHISTVLCHTGSLNP